MRDEELKPCPFCGGEPKLICLPDYLTEISCPTCNEMGKTDTSFLIKLIAPTKKDAITAWNRRADS